MLFACPHCQEAPSFYAFPLCDPCFSLLRPCPPLCSQCGSIGCPIHRCDYPWNESAISGYFSAFLLTDSCYSVLKRWKKSKGPLFSRRILTPSAIDPGGILPLLIHRHGVEAIVPMPQSFKRSFDLRGSPAEEVALALRRATRLPIQRELKTIGKRKRQAQLSQLERVSSPLRMEYRARREVPDSVLLVDDFMTTGKTLRAGASALRDAGVRKIFAYCLGVRPRRIRTDERSGIAA